MGVRVAYSPKLFNRPGAKSRAESEGLMAVENEDLTEEGLLAKMEEWQESEHGVDSDVYDDAKRRLKNMKIPSHIKRVGRVSKIADRIARDSMRGADANMDYQRKIRTVRTMVRQLDKELVRHESQQKRNTGDWGFVGDLGYVEEQLMEVLRFIGGGK